VIPEPSVETAMKGMTTMQENPNLAIADLVSRMPDSDQPGKTSTFTGPDPAAAEKIFGEILAGGREAIGALIDLVRATTDPDFRDYRPQYVLHGLAILAGRPGNEAARKVFADAIAEALGSTRYWRGVKALLIQELQAAGGPECATVLGGLLGDGDLCEPAAMALVAIGGTAETFRKAFPAAKGKSRATIAKALGTLKDAASLEALTAAAGDPDRDVRMAAVWGLARIGDPAAGEIALKAASAEDGWERTGGAKACLLLAEVLAAAGKRDEAKRVYEGLREGRKDPKDAYLRDAVARGLQSLVSVRV
jgi:hypothetical protein